MYVTLLIPISSNNSLGLRKLEKKIVQLLTLPITPEFKKQKQKQTNKKKHWG